MHIDQNILNNLENIRDSQQLINIMEKVLGKEKKNVIEEYYRNLYSQNDIHDNHVNINSINTVKLPRINHEYEQKDEYEHIYEEQKNEELQQQTEAFVGRQEC